MSGTKGWVKHLDKTDSSSRCLKEGWVEDGMSMEGV